MRQMHADLHIHSPHSIAVSKNMTLENIIHTCRLKGLDILGTGDITQPDWRSYLESNLEYKNGVYTYRGMYFIVQTELEDQESIHHVILLPTIEAGELLQLQIMDKAKGVTGQYGGRPHVNVSPPEIVEMVNDVGGVCGPAHAFTPFKAIFRSNKYASLEECYGSMTKYVYFLELGLSADTNLADRMACLETLTFLSNSDAHSEGPQSLGREFNRFYIEEPSFDEIVKALRRQQGRKITLNVGLEPRLGKYPMMFCKTCRIRYKLLTKDEVTPHFQSLPLHKTLFESYIIDGDDFVYYIFNSEEQLQDFRNRVGKKEVQCVKCALENKKSVISLGVFDRIDQIADYSQPKHPDHRPPYLGIIPLVEMIRVLKRVRSVKAKSVLKTYNELIKKFGTEFSILTDKTVLTKLRMDGTDYEPLVNLIEAFHEKKIEFIPGGGGKYGEIALEEI
ncbi:MAG: hypothetical protein JW776_06200 [Candidatus Lokiarchaeota archaeon]|nr:hypothetical protein [Candidatus Lokiarchaeota archaeon]